MNADDIEKPQAHFEGFAIVEQMGHNRYAGMVTTEAYGGAVLFRVDVPPLQEREKVLKIGEYVNGYGYVPPGSKVKLGAVQGYTKLIGAASIFAITPCTEAAMLKAVESMQARPMMVLEVPQEQAALPPASDEEEGEI